MPIYFSSCAFRGLAPEAMLEEVRAFPDAGLEFTAGLQPRDDWESILPVWKTSGAAILLHNYFPPPPEPFVINLAARDEQISQASMALCRRALKLTAAVGAPFFSVHSGFAMDMRPEQIGNHLAQARDADSRFDPAEALERFVQNVDVLAKEAANLGVRLLLENNVVSEAHREAHCEDALLLATPAAILEATAKFSAPVGLLLDVGHAKVTARTLNFSPADFFNLAVIEAFHLSDNDGLSDSNGPFSEDSWFASRLAPHAAKTMVIEVAGLTAPERRNQWTCLQSLLQK